MIKGFSLIEILVIVGLLGGISVVLSQSFFTVFRVNTKSEVMREIRASGEFSLRIMEQIIRESTKISSSCNGDFEKELTVADFYGNQTKFHCVDDMVDDLSITRLASTSGGLTQYLTSKNVTMGGRNCQFSSLMFSCLRDFNGKSFVRISLELSQVGSPQQLFERASIKFETTVNPRN